MTPNSNRCPDCLVNVAGLGVERGEGVANPLPAPQRTHPSTPNTRRRGLVGFGLAALVMPVSLSSLLDPSPPTLLTVEILRDAERLEGDYSRKGGLVVYAVYGPTGEMPIWKNEGGVFVSDAALRLSGWIQVKDTL